MEDKLNREQLNDLLKDKMDGYFEKALPLRMPTPVNSQNTSTSQATNTSNDSSSSSQNSNQTNNDSKKS